METQEKKRAEFEELVRPVMKWMSENLHPHTKIIIESNSAELLEGDMAVSTNEYLID
jgi:hypothetical protein